MITAPGHQPLAGHDHDHDHDYDHGDACGHATARHATTSTIYTPSTATPPMKGTTTNTESRRR
jgi:hypothetical protein